MKHVFAIPLENGFLSQHFGHCRQFAIVEVENGSITKQTFITPPPHEPGLLPAWLAEKGVTDIIASVNPSKRKSHIYRYFGNYMASVQYIISRHSSDDIMYYNFNL